MFTGTTSWCHCEQRLPFKDRDKKDSLFAKEGEREEGRREYVRSLENNAHVQQMDRTTDINRWRKKTTLLISQFKSQCMLLVIIWEQHGVLPTISRTTRRATSLCVAFRSRGERGGGRNGGGGRGVALAVMMLFSRICVIHTVQHFLIWIWFKTTYQFIDWLINCLIDWLIDRIDWLIDRLIDWLIDWLIELIDWLIDGVSDWGLSIYSSTYFDWLIDWLIDWLTDLLIDQVSDLGLCTYS